VRRAHGDRGAWNRDDVIVFAPKNRTPLYRVPAAGGEPTPVTTLDSSQGQNTHRFPYFLPGGRRFLYLARSSSPDRSGIFVGSLDSTVATRIISVDSMPAYAAPGYLLFARDRALRLGLPFTVAALIISPLAYFPTYLATATDPTIGSYFRTWLSFGDWPTGPAWFISLLLAFDCVAAMITALTPDWGEKARELTDGRGVDCVVEIGGPGTIAMSLKALAVGGHISLIGGSLSPSGTGLDPLLLTGRGITLGSISVGSRTDFETMSRAIALHRLRPVIDRSFPFAEANAAYRHFEGRGHFGKVVITHG